VRIILRPCGPETKIAEKEQRAGPRRPRCVRLPPRARSAGPGQVASLFAGAHREIVRRHGRCAGPRACRYRARYAGAERPPRLARNDASLAGSTKRKEKALQLFRRRSEASALSREKPSRQAKSRRSLFFPGQKTCGIRAR